MKTENISRLISDIENLKAWDIKAGPAGLHIYYGVRRELERCAERSMFSLWIRTAVRIVRSRTVLHQTNFPDERTAEVVAMVLAEKQVIKCGYDERNGSLRLLCPEDTLISVFPGSSVEELPWIFFDHRLKPAGNLVVFSDRIEGSLALRE